MEDIETVPVGVNRFRDVADQTEAPYLDALLEYASREPGRFHVPGHKGGPGADPGLREAIGEPPLRLDVPAGIEGIDVGEDLARNPFQRAQRLAAEAWGARRSWFLVNGGSGGNHAICLALAHLGERVVVQRNVHSSTIDGMVLAGLRPRFVASELDPELGIAHCLTPAALDSALVAEPAAVAALTVSPTYFGAVADVAALAEAAHARGVPLVVDEAWGAHLRFSPELPTSALECGADIVLSSIHKVVGSLTQSAILHLGESDGRVDEPVLDRSVTLVESTSPNALLTASLDAARRQAATRGAELLAETVGSLRRIREDVREIPGLDVIDESIAGRPGVHAYDPLRLVVDVRGTGVTGHRIAELMRQSDDINLELFAENVVVAAFGLGENAGETGRRLVEALRRAVRTIGESGERTHVPFAEPPPWGPPHLSPREAFLAPQEVVPFDAAEGRIAAESLAAYPPGVPNVLPGERLTRPTLEYIADSVAHGGMVRGASDRTLRTIRVVVE
jgi:arginine decarboxylase